MAQFVFEVDNFLTQWVNPQLPDLCIYLVSHVLESFGYMHVL